MSRIYISKVWSEIEFEVSKFRHKVHINVRFWAVVCPYTFEIS